ncbi:hypothetical protein SASPL_145395 [Salvia splendens]|uniref:Uncharacterized protein n=1 Tax=Salvia splendens TaxID=180675 RepID=A0A8X8WHM3_SALSN|nr:hypothetical protein SASPL_145395 [Salvia splendens]
MVSKDMKQDAFLLLTLFLAGCCTSCAVCIKSGKLKQPEALGISAELKSKIIFHVARAGSRFQVGFAHTTGINSAYKFAQRFAKERDEVHGTRKEQDV